MTTQAFKIVRDLYCDLTLSHCVPGLRIEWCKARAREGRWSEEVLLLLEEMRRVIEFFKWQAKWWKDRGTAAVFAKAAHQEGGLAYAARQAHIRLAMIKHVQEFWVAVLSTVESQLLSDDEDNTAETSDVLLTIEGPPANDEDNTDICCITDLMYHCQ